MVSADRLPTVTVYAAFAPSTDLKQVLQYTMNQAPPATYQFGFAASSGSVVDTHLIGNVAASTVGPIDTTPPVITINGGPTAFAGTTTPMLSGTTDAAPASTITIQVGTQKLITTVAPDGTWNATPPPTITISGGAKALTNLVRPTISGTSTGAAGRTVTVAVGGQKLTVVVSPAGAWSVVPATLTEGSHSVAVTVSATSGLKGTSSQTLTVDPIAPAIAIGGGSAMSTLSATPTISGRVNLPAGSSITVAVDGVAHTVAVSPTLTWSFTSPRLPVGAHAIVVSATDAAGNVGTQKQRLTVVPVLSIDGGSARLTNDATPTISGTTDAPSGTVVTVKLAGKTLTGTVTEAGTWSVTSESLSSAGYPVVATVRDAAGNVRTAWQNLKIDTIAPSIKIDGGSIATTKSATPTISGRVDVPAGTSISVAVDGVDQHVVVSPTRTWSLTSPHLKAGVHTVVVSATDAAGNVGTQRQRLTVTA